MLVSIYPDDISTREFVTSPDGYDRSEVKAYLQVLASEQHSLRQEVEALRAQRSDDGPTVGDEVASVLTTARAAAEDAVRLATKEADELRGRAQDDSDRLRRATSEASQKVRAEADAYAEQVRGEAEAEARRLLDETNDRIEQLLAGAATVRDKLLGLDEILAGARSEIIAAAGALDVPSVRSVPPPPPPAREEADVVDLREAQIG